uniref:Uncharacterized protein n=1 Tax=Rhizophagus irregularis (strain DAOM 181602 / DAOM 197198 / MUCL 43194) TaxID=747089 RepID=U9THH5_RHIID
MILKIGVLQNIKNLLAFFDFYLMNYVKESSNLLEREFFIMIQEKIIFICKMKKKVLN